MSFTLPDPLGTIETILTTDWDDTNTNSITPSFDRKAEFLRERRSYQVLIYPRVSTPTDVGRGEFIDWEDLATIEVRVKDTSGDADFNLIVQEVLRIIGSNRVGRSGSYDYIKYGTIRDESHRGQHWYRKLIDVELLQYNKVKTTTTIDEGSSAGASGAIYDEGDST